VHTQACKQRHREEMANNKKKKKRRKETGEKREREANGGTQTRKQGRQELVL
jgi:hypothetical protein